MPSTILSESQYNAMMRNRNVRTLINPTYPGEDDSAKRLQQRFIDPAHFAVKDYVGYWIFKDGNTRPVPMEVAYFARFLGYCIDLNLQEETIHERNEASLRRYREESKRPRISDEELFEMEAAFGKGATVVNVLTGEEIRI